MLNPIAIRIGYLAYFLAPSSSNHLRPCEIAVVAVVEVGQKSAFDGIPICAGVRLSDDVSSASANSNELMSKSRTNGVSARRYKNAREVAPMNR